MQAKNFVASCRQVVEALIIKKNKNKPLLL